jgi:O-antigen/teichoic acid export membrane protein
MTVRLNILANYGGTIIASTIPILALPWYLDFLGAEQFGLISFVIMLQAILGLIDAGMSQAMIRGISQRLGLKGVGERKAASFLFSFERIYWGFALIASLLTALFAKFIAVHWLNLGDLPVLLGEQAVLGAAVLFAVQFPGSIYRSMLVSSQKHTSLNIIISVFCILRHFGAVLLMMKWPFLFVYLAWHCVVGLLETLVRGYYAWGSLSIKRCDVVWSLSVLKSAWFFVAGMSAATWLGALTVQMDKIILSRMVPIDQFGYYVIAATVAAGSLQMIYPLVQVVLPRAIQLNEDIEALRALSFKLLKSIVFIVTVAGVSFFLGGHWALSLWLGNINAVESVFPLLSMLLVGTALNAIYNVGYIYWVVYENVKRILMVNAISLVLSLLLIPFLVLWQGVIGAAFGWIVINLIGFSLSLEWLRRGKSV